MVVGPTVKEIGELFNNICAVTYQTLPMRMTHVQADLVIYGLFV
jgi:hypothetical protein